MPDHEGTPTWEELHGSAAAKHEALAGAVRDYLNALASPAESSRGSVEACEEHRRRLAALVGTTYHNARST